MKSCTYRAEAYDLLQHLFQVNHMNDHTLHFSASFSGTLDRKHLARAVDLCADAFPLLRSGFREKGMRPFWEDRDYTSREMLQYGETQSPDLDMNRFLSQAVDPCRGPQIKLLLLRGGGSDMLGVRLNHMLCDAAGFKELLYRLARLYTGLEKGEDCKPEACGSRKIGQIRNYLPCRGKAGGMGSPDASGFVFEGDLHTPFIERREIPQEQFRSLKAYAKRNGATVNDVMLTAFLRVLFQMFGHTVSLPCTIDLRKYLPGNRAEGFCNLCSMLQCAIGSDIGEHFEQTLKKVKETMDRQKTDVSCAENVLLLEKAFNLLPYRLARHLVQKHYANAPISFTNIGILDKKRLGFGDTEMTGAFLTGSIKYSPYFQLAVSTFDDRPTLSVNLYGTPSDRNKIDAFLVSFLRELQEAQES